MDAVSVLRAEGLRLAGRGLAGGEAGLRQGTGGGEGGKARQGREPRVGWRLWVGSVQPGVMGLSFFLFRSREYQKEGVLWVESMDGLGGRLTYQRTLPTEDDCCALLALKEEHENLGYGERNDSTAALHTGYVSIVVSRRLQALTQRALAS